MKYSILLLLLVCNYATAQSNKQNLERLLNGNPDYTLVSARESNPDLVMVFDRTTYKEDYDPDANITLGSIQYTSVYFSDQRANKYFVALDITTCKKDKGRFAYAMPTRSQFTEEGISIFDLSRHDEEIRFANDIARAVCAAKQYNDSLVKIKISR